MKKKGSIFLLALFSLGVWVINIFPTYVSAEEQTGQYNKSTWMGSLLDSTPVSDISIPGTHDTMAFQGNWEIPEMYKPFIQDYQQYNYLVEAVAKTQDLSLNDQLNQGVRYLDIRVSTDMTIHHDYIDLKSSFNNDVLKTIKDFLEKNPSETIITRIKSENVPQGERDLFNTNITEVINQYKDLFTSTDSTKLKDVRGKVIVLDDTDTRSFINNNVATKIWGNDGSVIQDDYNNPTKETKFIEIQNLITEASTNKSQFFFNHISATRGMDAVTINYNDFTASMSDENREFTPKGYADTLNPQVINFITNESLYNHKLGVLIWDFISNAEINAVIASNEHLKDKSSLNVHDSIINENDIWQAQKNFTSGVNGQGDPIEFIDLDVSGTVNTSVPGDYKIIYTYEDSLGNTISKSVTVTVQKKAQVTYHKVTFLAGNGGTIANKFEFEVPDGKSVVEVPEIIPNKSDVEDIVFLDWYQDGIIVNPEQISITKDTTFIAKLGTAVYRLYNQNDGDHLLTKNKNEKNHIISEGWKLESSNSTYGTAAFYVPVKEDSKGKKQVYRVYNPVSGEHFYTTLKAEADSAVNSGWINESHEDFTWVSDGDVKMYREFNPNTTTAGSHNFTTNPAENQWLVAQGWIDESKESSLWNVLKAGF